MVVSVILIVVVVIVFVVVVFFFSPSVVVLYWKLLIQPSVYSNVSLYYSAVFQYASDTQNARMILALLFFIKL